MRDNCEIIKDLLPLYVEDLTSESSNQFIEEHLHSCAECVTYLENIKRDLPTVEDSFAAGDYDDQEMVKRIKKRMMNQRFITAAIGILAVLVVSMNFFPWASIGLIGFLLFIGAIVYVLY